MGHVRRTGQARFSCNCGASIYDLLNEKTRNIRSHDSSLSTSQPSGEGIICCRLDIISVMLVLRIISIAGWYWWPVPLNLSSNGSDQGTWLDPFIFIDVVLEDSHSYTFRLNLNCLKTSAEDLANKPIVFVSGDFVQIAEEFSKFCVKHDGY